MPDNIKNIIVLIFRLYISLNVLYISVAINDKTNIINVLIVVINIESTLFNLEEYDAKTDVSPENIADTKA